MIGGKAASAMASFWFVLAMVFPATQGFSHEGHDHAPGAAQAPHGGIVQEAKSLRVELVVSGAEIKVYPLSLAMKPVPLKEVQVVATAQAPKKAKIPVKFVETHASDPVNAHYAATPDITGAHRFTLELTLSFRGKKERVEFQIEPGE